MVNRDSARKPVSVVLALPVVATFVIAAAIEVVGEEAKRAVNGAGISGTLRSEPVLVNADPQRVRQILRNLLTNAKRYGGPQVRIDFAEAAEWTEVVWPTTATVFSGTDARRSSTRTSLRMRPPMRSALQGST